MIFLCLSIIDVLEGEVCGVEVGEGVPLLRIQDFAHGARTAAQVGQQGLALRL